MKKKILALCLVIALALTAVTGATLAYFTDNDRAENVFTVGNVNIDLIELEWDENGSLEAENVYPGQPLAKDPRVTNDGANPCFVRVKVEGLNCLGDSREITLRYEGEAGYNTTDWTLIGDYYYYNKVLDVNATTNPVFDQIVIPTSLTNNIVNDKSEYPDELTIPVFAEAVQAQGASADVETMTAQEIAAWFDICMPAENE